MKANSPSDFEVRARCYGRKRISTSTSQSQGERGGGWPEEQDQNHAPAAKQQKKKKKQNKRKQKKRETRRKKRGGRATGERLRLWLLNFSAYFFSYDFRIRFLEDWLY